MLARQVGLTIVSVAEQELLGQVRLAVQKL